MKTRIIEGLEEGLAQQLSGEFIASFRLRQRMADLLQKDIDAAHRSMRDEEKMSSPNWAFLQASKIGEVKALIALQSLLREK